MADLSEFHELSTNGRACKVRLAIEKLDAEEVKQLEAALAEDQAVITNAAIQKWLERRGHEMHPQTVLSHRKGNCACKGRS